MKSTRWYEYKRRKGTWCRRGMTVARRGLVQCAAPYKHSHNSISGLSITAQ
jgi:hypothetical protein